MLLSLTKEKMSPFWVAFLLRLNFLLGWPGAGMGALEPFSRTRLSDMRLINPLVPPQSSVSGEGARHFFDRGYGTGYLNTPVVHGSRAHFLAQWPSAGCNLPWTWAAKGWPHAWLKYYAVVVLWSACLAVSCWPFLLCPWLEGYWHRWAPCQVPASPWQSLSGHLQRLFWGCSDEIRHVYCYRRLKGIFSLVYSF